MAGRVRHRSWQEVVVAAALLVLAAWLVWHARTFGPQARILPLAAGIPLLALTAVNLVSLTTRGRSGAPPTGTPEQGAGAAVVSTERGLPPVQTFLALAILVAVFLLFGMIIAALTYPAGVMRFYGKHSWTRSIVASGATCAVLYGASRALGITLFEGWLFLEGFLPGPPL